MRLFKSFYILPRFFYGGLLIISLLIASYFVPAIFFVAELAILVQLTLFVLDTLLVFIGKNKIKAQRIVPDKLSNGDANTIGIAIENHYHFTVGLTIIDEIPFQFQIRDFTLKTKIEPKKTKLSSYTLSPKARGEYHFGALNLYASTRLGLVAKRFRFNSNAMVPSYPSYKQLRKYALLNVHQAMDYGLKKTRRIGHSMEFEQIKDYVPGDDIRTINWKATAKKNSLMVNQFQDEKSQPIYSVIDKGRVMKMPFNGLSLLDYAINSALVISSIALKKQDRVGMLAFSKNIENMVMAQRRNSQMRLLLEGLYNIKTNFLESDFSRLYANIKRHITQRSLILLYTNFETLDGLNRQLPFLKALAKSHLLVVIFFKNTELNHIIEDRASSIQEVYNKVIAEKFAFEKRLIVNELKKYGIATILTTPENLTIDTINTYLEIKSRGLL